MKKGIRLICFSDKRKAIVPNQKIIEIAINTEITDLFSSIIFEFEPAGIVQAKILTENKVKQIKSSTIFFVFIPKN